MDAKTMIGVFCTLLGAVIGYITFWRGAQKTVKEEGTQEGRQDGTILTELGYIKANTDEIKLEQKEQRKLNTEMLTRLTAVEASTKSAHKRIDMLGGLRE